MSIERLSLHPQRQLTYLGEVDGLRAIAVLAVLLFHLEVSGFSGGYVGVDIFFVVSGFLISGLIRSRVQAQTFHLSNFYANRVMRLFPAVLATVAITAVVATLILQPYPLKSFAASAIGSVFSAANFVFFYESGYWDTNAKFKPLLHLWSLGVEEQFYLFWPSLIVLLSTRSNRLYLLGLITITAVSAFACIAYTPVNSAATFYLLPFRIWQFSLGALVVELWRSNLFSPKELLLLQVLGITLCLFSIVTFGESTQFPGSLAMIPSFGAALVLLSAQSTPSGRGLANPIARWIGTVSYSIYLVHWPPIALYKSYTLADLTPSAQLWLAALSLFLTVLVHYGVERRFYKGRSAKKVTWRGSAGFTALLGIAITLVLVGPLHSPDRFSFRPTILSAATIQEYKERRFLLPRKFCRIDQIGKTPQCPQPNASAVLFIGNSHEPDSFNIVSALIPDDFQKPLIRFGTTNGCKNLRETATWATSSNKFCNRRLDALYSSLDTIVWDTVFIGALHPYAEENKPLVQLLETLRKYQPHARIVLFSDYISTIEPCANLINHFGNMASCGHISNIENLPGLIKKPAPLLKRLDAVTDITIDKIALLCDEILPSSCPTRTPDGHPMSMDKSHLTAEFAYWLGEKLVDSDPQWLKILNEAEPASPSAPDLE